MEKRIQRARVVATAFFAVLMAVGIAWAAWHWNWSLPLFIFMGLVWTVATILTYKSFLMQHFLPVTEAEQLGYVRRVGPGEYRILSFFVFPDDYPDAKTDDEFMRHYAGMYFVIVGISTVSGFVLEPMQLLRLPRVGQNEVRRWFNEPSQYRKTLVVDSEKPDSCELMGGAFSPLTCAIRMNADPSSF